jgi:hypothetical protein
MNELEHILTLFPLSLTPRPSSNIFPRAVLSASINLT